MARVVDRSRSLAAVERACTTAATADELLETLSHEMQRAVPFDGAAWFGLDPVTLLAAAPSRVEALAPEMCEPFWHVEFNEHDAGLFADLARGDGVYAMRLELGEAAAKSARFRDVMAPQGYDDELRAVFRAGDRAWGCVALYREPTQQRFAEDDLDFLRAISGSVATALRSHIRDVSRPESQPSAPGLLMVDRDGRVISSNAEAHVWLEHLWPESADGAGIDELTLYNLRDRALEVPTPLFALVSRARAVAEGREHVPARLRLRDRNGRWLVLHASALSGGPGGTSDTVALVIEAAKSAEIAPIIIDAHSLTPREREVLAAIARGGSTAEIAAELFLSPHTVRDYVKTVFEKFGVSSRGELVAKLFREHFVDPLHETMVHA